MITLRFLISVSALWCLCTTTLFLKAQGRSDMPIDDCGYKIIKIGDVWQPSKDSVFRFTPFSNRIKANNSEFIKVLGSLIECCCPVTLISQKNLNSIFPKPDITVKTDTTIKQYYFVRNKEYCQYKSKKTKLSDNIPYLIILIFDKKDQLLKQVITN